MCDHATPQPPASLEKYLTRHDFTPHPGNSAWLDHNTGQQIIRVCHDPGEATLLYCLTPSTVCLYEAIFSPSTPDAIIIAAVQTALQHIPPQTGYVGESRRQLSAGSGARSRAAGVSLSASSEASSEAWPLPRGRQGGRPPSRVKVVRPQAPPAGAPPGHAPADGVIGTC